MASHSGHIYEDTLEKLERLNKRLLEVMAVRDPIPRALMGPSDALMNKATAAFAASYTQDPAMLIARQAKYWQQTLQTYQEIASDAPDEGTDDDPRFSNPMWRNHPYFRVIKQQYTSSRGAALDTIEGLADLSPQEKRRLRFFTKRLFDMMAPTNFLGTNPDALERAAATNGESLVQGLENLIRDLELYQGDPFAAQAKASKFEVGKNLATTEGQVVFRNELIELIEYAPTTDHVHEIPLLIFPPWVNKFYILDLSAKKSLVKFMVDQGFRVFMVSWINPDEGHADVGLSDYMRLGYGAAMDEVAARSSTGTFNVTGYCIGGTTLALTLAKHKADDRIKSATFFTTLTDFTEQGDVGMFIDDDFVDGIENDASRNGMMRDLFLRRTFSVLRANDLIYRPAIRSYLMGKTTPLNDLMYWNTDGTNLPAKMAVEYLRDLCQRNEFAGEGLEVDGTRLSLSDIALPVFMVGCETDHIAPWDATYDGLSQMGSEDKTFVLAQAGHVAGIVHEPGRYGHYTYEDTRFSSETWKAQAHFHDSAWWLRWAAWLAPRSGAKVPAKAPIGGICSAPGTYVYKSLHPH